MRKDRNAIFVMFLAGVLLMTASLAGCTEDDGDDKTPTGDHNRQQPGPV